MLCVYVSLCDLFDSCRENHDMFGAMDAGAASLLDFAYRPTPHRKHATKWANDWITALFEELIDE